LLACEFAIVLQGKTVGRIQIQVQVAGQALRRHTDHVSVIEDQIQTCGVDKVVGKPNVLVLNQAGAVVN
jgi:hypothetical protein